MKKIVLAMAIAILFGECAWANADKTGAAARLLTKQYIEAAKNGDTKKMRAMSLTGLKKIPLEGGTFGRRFDVEDAKVIKDTASVDVYMILRESQKPTLSESVVSPLGLRGGEQRVLFVYKWRNGGWKLAEFVTEQASSEEANTEGEDEAE